MTATESGTPARSEPRKLGGSLAWVEVDADSAAWDGGFTGRLVVQGGHRAEWLPRVTAATCGRWSWCGRTGRGSRAR